MGRRLVSSASPQMDRTNCPDNFFDLVTADMGDDLPDKNWMLASRATFVSFQGTLLILGIIVNSLICYVMLRRRKINKSTSNFFLFHLSLTELILWLIVFPIAMMLQISQMESVVPCKILIFVVFTCESVMFGLLSTIAIDKYTNIVNPFKGLVLEERKITALILVWVYAVVTSASFLYSVQETILILDLTTLKITRKYPSDDFDSVHNGSNATGSFTTVTPTGNSHSNAFSNVTQPHRHNTGFHTTVTPFTGANVTGNFSTGSHNTSCVFPLRVCDIPTNIAGQLSCTLYFIFSFLIPLIFIIVAYSKVVRRLWVRSRAYNEHSKTAKAKLRAVRMLVLVVLTYLITDGPWTIAFLVYTYSPRDVIPFEEHYTTVSIVATLFYASSVLSPLVTAMNSATVQQEVRRIICCQGDPERDGTTANSSLTSKVDVCKPYKSIKFTKGKITGSTSAILEKVPT